MTNTSAHKTGTLRIETTRYVCAHCPTSRPSQTGITLHLSLQHDVEFPIPSADWTVKVSEYGQPASLPVRDGDIIVSAEFS